MKRAVKSLKARPSPKTTFFLLSNANALFIETILQVRFSQPLLPSLLIRWRTYSITTSEITFIKSSPTRLNSSRASSSSEDVSIQLGLNTRVKSPAIPTCAKVRCSLLENLFCANLTHAGEELDAYIESQGGWDSFDRVVYVGDGSNDLCPVLRLRKYVLSIPPSQLLWLTDRNPADKISFAHELHALFRDCSRAEDCRWDSSAASRNGARRGSWKGSSTSLMERCTGRAASPVRFFPLCLRPSLLCPPARNQLQQRYPYTESIQPPL